MIDSFQTLGSFLLVLGILVFVHEFGHFIVAKAFGIGVPVFSLGFGPRLVGFRRRETDYRISLIPLGGYVRLTGDEADEARTGAADEFLTRPRWQRFLVFVAGATFNVVLALVVTWWVFWIYGQDEIVPSETHPIVAAVQQNSTAEAAGVNVGDRVITIAGKDAREPSTLQDEILLSPGTVKELVVERDGSRRTLLLNTGADPRYKLGHPGWQFESEEPVLIDSVTSGSPAERAGLQAQDRVVGIDGIEPVLQSQLREILAASGGREVRLRIEREGRPLDVTVVPEPSEAGRAQIGVYFRPAGLVHRELSFTQAAVASWHTNLELTQLLFKTLRRLVRRDVSVRALSGPIEIARVSRMAVRSLQSFLGFLAFISLQLGILNLLPIPVLDGGHILILAVEGTMRRDLSDRLKERVMQVGLAFLLAFFGVVIYFDLLKAWVTS